MTTRFARVFPMLACVALALCGKAGSDDGSLTLGNLFTDHMVVQRGRPVRVWGTGPRGQHVTVSLADVSGSAVCSEEGRWEATLPALPEGGPHTLRVRGKETLRRRDVLIGDVWLCSGQSNMAWPVRSGQAAVADAEREVREARWPQIRLFTVTPRNTATPMAEVDGTGWKVCSPDSVGPFSAVGYFFGREVHRHTGVPVGLINCSRGGTAIEAWTSEQALRRLPHMARFLDVLQNDPGIRARVTKSFDEEFAAWMRRLNESDAGHAEDEPSWAEPDVDVSGWPSMDLPQYWEDAGFPDLDGLMWFRRDVRTPASWAGEPLHLHVGAVNDRLEAWFNGTRILSWSDSSQPSAGYAVPAELVRKGRNTVALRVYDMGGRGGFSGKADDFWLRRAGRGGRKSIPLARKWSVKPGFSMDTFPPIPRPPLLHPANANTPTELFNGMVAPLTRLPIRGIVWYQGEANSQRAEEYQALFPALIEDWRAHWAEADLPFLFVQLPNYLARSAEPVDEPWAKLREAQSMALCYPDTGMAVTIDLGETEDIHPPNKQDVGKRLALLARRVAYNEDLVCTGPFCESYSREGARVRLKFSAVGGGLVAEGGGPLTGFAVAGADRRFVWADACIEGDSVLVWNDIVSEPAAVRYAWANNPLCNLYNREGLPAAPFRTDNWPGVTSGKKLELPAPAGAQAHADSEDAVQRQEPPAGLQLAVDVAYGTASQAQRLDILYPSDVTKRRPAVMLIHGGGWYLGDKGGASTFDTMCRLAEAGYAVLSVNYRLSDEALFPAAVDDCRLAVRWLRAHADQYGIDPARVGVMGGSAGGHLAAMLAVTPEDWGDNSGGYAEESSAVQAAVPVCPPMDLRRPLAAPPAEEPDPVVVRFLGGPPAEKQELAQRASPISYVREDLPPMLLVHGTADRRVDPAQSRAMADALAAAGAPSELLFVEGGKHGMGVARTDASFARILEFFRRHLLEPASGGTQDGADSAAPDRIRWWQDAKFGLFIHWGPSSLTGKEISWCRAGERRGLPGLPAGDVPVAEYDRLYERFNPRDFSASQWVNVAKAAGVKYLVFTAKHHDGFCMFDSAATGYDIAASPFRADIVAELAKACHEGGIGFGVYYSLPDWHHPDYLTDRHARYVAYLRDQVTELCSNYGRIDILWFDGGRKASPETWGAAELLPHIRQLQPGILVNNRIPGPTDFDTPEQVVGRCDIDQPWESCISLGQQWSWKPGDEIKSVSECLHALLRCVGGGGNMLLNVGPMPNGAIEERQVERLMEVGDWLGRYGESVYGTRGGPYAPSYWGASTRKDNRIYLHIFDGWEESLSLPPLERTVVSSRVLSPGEARVTQSEKGLTVTRSRRNPDPPVSVIELTLDGPAAPIPVKPSGLVTPAGAVASASNVRRGEERYAPAGAVDADPMSRWASDDGVTRAWLEIRLPEPLTFDVITMDEAFGNRIRAFELQTRTDTGWRTFYTGTTVGRNWAGAFEPVTTRDVRLEILDASDGPTIRDIQFHCVAH